MSCDESKDKLVSIATSLRKSAQYVFQSVIDFIYPPACPHCHRPQERCDEFTSAALVVCNACRDELWPADGEECPACAAPVGPFLGEQPNCRHCRTDRFAFEGVVRLGVFAGALGHACLLMKIPGNVPLICAAGDLLWERERERLRRFQADVVIPVPQHWTTQICHRHNPAAELARFLAMQLDVPYAGKRLRKVRRTPRQTTLTPTKRRTNLRNAFAARLPKKLRSARVLLVDDVLTTGSTAHRATRALQQAGAGSVLVAVLARGIGRR